MADTATTLKVQISKLQFTQSSVAATFQNGGKIEDLVEDLKALKVKPDDLPTLNVFEDDDGKLWCLDNRRLLSFKLAFHGKLALTVNVFTERNEDRFLEWVEKMTTGTGGGTIRVRDGKPGWMPRVGAKGAYFVFLQTRGAKDRKVYWSQLTDAQKAEISEKASQSNDTSLQEAVQAASALGNVNAAHSDNDEDEPLPFPSKAFSQYLRGAGTFQKVRGHPVGMTRDSFDQQNAVVRANVKRVNEERCGESRALSELAAAVSLLSLGSNSGGGTGPSQFHVHAHPGYVGGGYPGASWMPSASAVPLGGTHAYHGNTWNAFQTSYASANPGSSRLEIQLAYYAQ